MVGVVQSFLKTTNYYGRWLVWPALAVAIELQDSKSGWQHAVVVCLVFILSNFNLSLIGKSTHMRHLACIRSTRMSAVRSRSKEHLGCEAGR